jgi:exonuclease III
MNHNSHRSQNSDRPNTLESQVGDGGGAQEEPYMSVRSAHVRPGNPRTGYGPTGLAIPASVHETPTHVSPEAEDAPHPGRGSGDDETDPFRSLFIRAEDSSDDQSDNLESEDESLTFSSDDKDTPVLAKKVISRTTKNKPKKRPGINIASLNMRGRQKDNKDKLRMVIDWMRTNHIAILALQETHLMEASIVELNLKYKSMKFFGSGLSTSSGGIMFIIDDRAGTPQNIRFEKFEDGRIGMLSLEYGDQELNIVNVYMPNHKAQQKEALINLKRDLKERQHITETDLLLLGDWNFVEDKIDRSPQHDDDRGVTGEMATLKASFDLVDGWRKSNPKARSFSWEGTTGSDKRRIFSRIDRIYTSKRTWEITNEYKIINCDISDHDGISVTIRDASAPDTGKGEQKLNLSILNHPLFRKEADRLINKLEKRLNQYERMEKMRSKSGRLNDLQKLRTGHNPQNIWIDYKKGILAASAQATQYRRGEITRTRRAAEREIKKAERDLRDCQPEREEECRKTLSDCKKTLNDYDEEARNNRTHLNEAKWFKDNERASKRWFGLNRPRASSTMIKSIFRANLEIETEDPKEMLEIARHYHSQLQSEPPMNKDQKRAIEDILASMGKILSEEDQVDVGKDVSFREVNDAIRKAPSSKAPGPDGIPNEFWKLEIKWRDQMKQEKRHQPGMANVGEDRIRPCIAALMTKVYQDVELFGPVDVTIVARRHHCHKVGKWKG